MNRYMLATLEPWSLMWLAAFTLFALLKLISLRVATIGPSLWRVTLYLVTWPGLDAAQFLGRGTGDAQRTLRSSSLQYAMARFSLGVLLIWGVARMLPTDSPVLVGWIGMLGLLAILHFGLFDVLAVLWQKHGTPVRPIMNAPWRSTSLSEFWGRRWNTAFRDIAHALVFTPVARRLGAPLATWCAFLFSGLVHDAVISLPCRAGFGLPTSYFLLQAMGMQIQRSGWARRHGFERGVKGWVTTATVILAPAGLLFHRAFLAEVIVPFLTVIYAI